MFSPFKAITAGALVFAIGGVLLIAQPFDQQRVSVPGAATDEEPAAPVKFTAVFRGGPQISKSTCEVVDGVRQCAGQAWSFPVSEVSDKRLGGLVTVSQNQNQYPGQPSLLTETYRIVNDDGAWQGSFHSMRDGGDFGNASVVLVGEGGNKDLYAWMDVSDWNAISGVIFSAPPPEAPAPPSTD